MSAIQSARAALSVIAAQAATVIAEIDAELAPVYTPPTTDPTPPAPPVDPAPVPAPDPVPVPPIIGYTVASNAADLMTKVQALRSVVSTLSKIEPRITGFAWGPGGAYVDVTIRLPHGGNLSTAYKEFQAGAYAGSFEATNWVAPTILPETTCPQLHNVQGFSIIQGGLRKFSGFTAEIQNTGTGSGASRTGVVRVTPTTPFVSGDTIAFGYGDGHNLLTAPEILNGRPHLHWPLETRTHVSGGGYGYPVIREAGDTVLATMP